MERNEREKVKCIAQVYHLIIQEKNTGDDAKEVTIAYRATQIKTYSWDNAQVILVGNKCDMEDERIIPIEKGKHLADQLGFDYFEVSAKENINVRQVFERLVDIICEKMSESMESEASKATAGKNVRLTYQPPPLQQKCSC